MDQCMHLYRAPGETRDICMPWQRVTNRDIPCSLTRPGGSVPRTNRFAAEGGRFRLAYGRDHRACCALSIVFIEDLSLGK